MKGEIDLKKLWKQKQVITPSFTAIKEEFNKYKKEEKRKTILINFIGLFSISYFIFIGCFFSPELLSTKLGLLLVFLAIILFVIAYNITIPFVKSASIVENASCYLEQVLAFKKKQAFLQGSMLSAYFILLSLGIALFMYEYVIRINGLMLVVSYFVLGVWIAINWFYFRPKTIKKTQSKLNSLIAKYKDVNKQFKQTEKDF